MKCKTIHKELIFFLDGELPQQKMHEVALHLDECAGCAAFADDMRKTLSIVELEKNIQVSPYFYTRLKTRMEKKQEPEVLHVGFQLVGKVLQPVMFSVLLLTGIYTGIKIGEKAGGEIPETGNTVTEIIPYLNELEAEPIEMFFMD